MLSDRPDDHTTLVSRLEAGETKVLEELLVRHLPQLEAFVRIKAGPGIRADESLSDVIQSVCCDVLAAQSRFDYRGEAEFRHWLCTQALHKIVSKARYHRADKRDRRREVPIATPSHADLCATIVTPSRVVAAKEQWHAVETAFDDLPDDYREALMLRRIVGLDYPRIAATLDRSEGAVRNLVYRATARLSTLLADAEDSA